MTDPYAHKRLFLKTIPLYLHTKLYYNSVQKREAAVCCRPDRLHHTEKDGVPTMKVKISDILDAMEMSDPYSEYFLDRETGEIVWISEMGMTSDEREKAHDQLDEHGFYRLPTSFDIREYDMMEDFIDFLPDPARTRLAGAIRGKGAFRRFKDTIRQLGIDDQWYEFRDIEYAKKAIEWCIENNLEFEV